MFEDTAGDSNREPVGFTGSLSAVDPTDLNDRQLRDAIGDFEQLTSWAQAGQLEALAEMNRRANARNAADAGPLDTDDPAAVAEREEDVAEFVSDEVAIELTMSARAAKARLDLALELAAFPATRSAFKAGQLDRYKAGIITTELGYMCDPTFAEVIEAGAIEYGRRHTGAQLRSWMRRRILKVEPGVAETRRQEAVAGRKVSHWAGFDGMGTICAELSAADALAVYRMVDQVAHASRYTTDDLGNEVRARPPPVTEDSSMDARRADALVDLVLGRAPRIGTTEIQVSVSAETLAGVSEESGVLAGHGPITAEHARQLAAGDSRWRRLLFDPHTGRLQDLSQHSYRPGAALARGIKARDQVCRFPGCNRAATSSGVDLDHTTPWPAGSTCPDNLALLCRHHHRLKQDPQWQVVQLAGNILEWTTPSGRVFHTYPADHRPDQPRSGAPPDKAA